MVIHMYSKPGYIHVMHRVHYIPSLLCTLTQIYTHYLDKLDAVGSFRRRKRHLSSEAEEEELSLTNTSVGNKRKRMLDQGMQDSMLIAGLL